MSKTMKKVSVLLLSILMIVSFMPMMQENAYAAAKKPGKVKGVKISVNKTNNKVTVKWTKLKKNVKKYEVSITDGSTKLTASKKVKKTKNKITFQGGNKVKYTVKVRGLNGKKAGKWSAKKKKTTYDLVKKIQDELDKAKEEADAAKEDAGDKQDHVDELDQKLRDLLTKSERLDLDSWNPEVKSAINEMIYRNSYEDKYVVFDFDNTCSIFDVEEQLAIYQLQTMSFAEGITKDELANILKQDIAQDSAKFPQGLDTVLPKSDWAGTTYNQWINDITNAYQALLDKGYTFKPTGLSEADQEKIQKEAAWKEFATKMRAMYDLVYDNESAAVAYPWVLFWFAGMTEDEVYDLAAASHTFYKNVKTSTEVWQSPANYPKAHAGQVTFKWTSGTAVSENIVELMGAFKNNGIDVWVCSASATDPIRAAIDVWGLHDVVTGMMAMTNKLDDNGKYLHEYDWETGQAWKPLEIEEGKTAKESWQKIDGRFTKTQTQGEGKVIAIKNICYPEYENHGPIAGFMDSTGDFNFCTEFEELEVVCCFNRASRKVTDGGGVISELAVYQGDTLFKADDDYTSYEKARKAGDTLYVLQGREENDFRGLRPKRTTMLLDATEEKLFKNNDNVKQLEMMDGKTTGAIIDQYAIKTAANDPANDCGFDYGFVTGTNIPHFEPDWTGYHSNKAPYEPELLEDEDWAPRVKDNLNAMMSNVDNTTGQYVVFDFDNTCSIFDVEEQLAVYQLQVMAFDETVDVEELEAILKQDIAQDPSKFPDQLDTVLPKSDWKGTTYNQWIEDITYLYGILLDRYGVSEDGEPKHFLASGFDEDDDEDLLEGMWADRDWLEFATKMRAMYDLVYDNESAAVAYPWVLFWFAGMTQDEVYDLAYRSHSKYDDTESEYRYWEYEPRDDSQEEAKVDDALEDSVVFKWTAGTTVSYNIKELMRCLDANGIDVWVCSASAVDPIRAAIDYWDLHEYVTGVMAMTNKLEDGCYLHQYDWETGQAWKPTVDEDDDWDWEPIEGRYTTTQTQGEGKVTAIKQICYPAYNNHGPIAGFMDSTGDFNFCTEFKTLQVVCCFNRASRKVTDGGGVISELAVYQEDTLGLNYDNRGDDTVYVLQGREENEYRGLRPSRETMVLDATEPKLFKNNDNVKQLEMMDGKTTEAIINQYAIKTPADDPANDCGFEYGFLTGQEIPYFGVDWTGYHSID